MLYYLSNIGKVMNSKNLELAEPSAGLFLPKQ